MNGPYGPESVNVGLKTIVPTPAPRSVNVANPGSKLVDSVSVSPASVSIADRLTVIDAPSATV